jgi:hypothetical protein
MIIDVANVYDQSGSLLSMTPAKPKVVKVKAEKPPKQNPPKLVNLHSLKPRLQLLLFIFFCSLD